MPRYWCAWRFQAWPANSRIVNCGLSSYVYRDEHAAMVEHEPVWDRGLNACVSVSSQRYRVRVNRRRRTRPERSSETGRTGFPRSFLPALLSEHGESLSSAAYYGDRRSVKSPSQHSLIISVPLLYSFFTINRRQP